MRTIRLTLEYDGAHFAGWQRQRAAPSVQEAVERAVAAVTGEPARVVGAGRTDAGVHALGQVAHFLTASRVPAAGLPGALNAHLPDDVVVLDARDAPEGFHARRSAVSRAYRYVVLNRARPSALLRGRAHHVAAPLDAAAMHAAASRLVGRRDFAPFHATGSAPRTTICDLRRAAVRRRRAFVIAEFEADRFLRHMVRLMMGTLVRVGLGRWRPEAVDEILAGARHAGPRLPAGGLYLIRVRYPDDSA